MSIKKYSLRKARTLDKSKFEDLRMKVLILFILVGTLYNKIL